MEAHQHLEEVVVVPLLLAVEVAVVEEEGEAHLPQEVCKKIFSLI